MADVSVPSLILFIASIVVAAGVAGVLIDTVTGISGALDDRGADVAENIRTDIEVISDSQSNVYNAGTLTLYVKNTGRRTIPATGESVDVIVDAQYRTNVSVTVVDGGTEWTPHGVVRVTIGDLTPLDPGDHRVRLVVSGDEETFRFTTT
ncbi:flagellar protein G [Halobellus salinus]|uniref:Flagellar protein G n=1 Tax=Halobellus salinus TaxID=931585 RepID=A0A830EFB8_9EURY|nr:flagellar protein G [Halobellus salinus]GGJ04802.1 flagellar protein G [Halobellus salinus]SMP09368.1 flagellar protein FlaG [Halobellus salinus]